MNLDFTNKQIIKNVLRKHDLRPNKGLGQNFLISRIALQKIVKAANLSKDDIVLEIGPGIGTLTQELAKRARRVIAVEKDPKMCQILKETLKEFKNVEIIQGDALKLPMNSEQRTMNNKSLPTIGYWLLANNYKIVSNLPYYITSPVIRKFLETPNPPELMLFMIQKEVAQRITAKPPKMSLLAVSVQFYAEPKIIAYIPKTAFWPAPKVDSAIIKIVPRGSAYDSLPNRQAGASFRDQFFKVVRAGFSHPRKQIIGNLIKQLEINRRKAENWLKDSGIQPEQRAESLSIEDWISLIKNVPK